MAGAFQEIRPQVRGIHLLRDGLPRASVAPELVWLEDVACRDATLVGGKAAQLSRLAAHYRVPPGFCLTAAAYNAAVDSGALSHSRLAPRLYDQLAEAYREMAKRCGSMQPRVAVRSSALDEDGAGTSFAGQHETYLNIVNIDALVDAVVRCWDSLRSERALDYRRQRGLTLDNARLAVLVQQLVTADVSAVVFSANPITGGLDEVVINASWGLGESIVGGTVTPDTYVVRKLDQSIVSRQVAAKRRMTVLAPHGTREADVPRLMQSRPALADEQIAEMAGLAIALEESTGWPVDIEWAYASGQLHLLQCRPITTLRPSLS